MAKQKRTARAGKPAGGKSGAQAASAKSKGGAGAKAATAASVAKIASSRGRSSGHLKKARRQVKHNMFVTRALQRCRAALGGAGRGAGRGAGSWAWVLARKEREKAEGRGAAMVLFSCWLVLG